MLLHTIATTPESNSIYVPPDQGKRMWLRRFLAMLLLLFGISLAFGIPRLQNDARMDEMEMLLLNSAPEGSQITGMHSEIASMLSTVDKPWWRKLGLNTSMSSVMYLETEMIRTELADYYNAYSFGSASEWLYHGDNGPYANVAECDRSGTVCQCTIILGGDLANNFDVRRLRTFGFFCYTSFLKDQCTSWETCVPSFGEFLRKLWVAVNGAGSQQ